MARSGFAGWAALSPGLGETITPAVEGLGPSADFAEDAAGAAGEWVARNSPELVSETLVPRFIRGFEKAHRSSSDDDDGGESS